MEPDRKQTTRIPQDEAVDLLTQLYNAYQRFEFADMEYENARDNRKMAKEEVNRLLLIIKGETPRIHGAIKEKNLLHNAMLELPPIVEWRKDLEAPKTIGGANDGAPTDEKPAADEAKGDDPNAVSISVDGKTVKFSHFKCDLVRPGTTEGDADEWEVRCDDCGKQISRVFNVKGNDPIVRLQAAAKGHDDLFHAPPRTDAEGE